MMLPGIPRLKLTDPSAVALGIPAASLPRAAGGRKRWVSAPVGWQDSAVPVRRIYVLETGRAHTTSPLSMLDLFLALVRHAFPTVSRSLQARGCIEGFMRQCAILARSVEGYRLACGHTLATLPTVVAALTEGR